MTFASVLQPLLDSLAALGIRLSFAPFVAGVLCIYLAFKNDNDREAFAAYALAAVTFFSVAIFLLAGLGSVDLSHVLASVGLQ